MNKKQKLIFVALCLFPFVLAMSFRTVDNYQFALEHQRSKKLNPDYFPHNPSIVDQEPEHEFTCHKLQLASDSTGISKPGITELP